MSDQTVSEALRSNARLVVVEAAAGCGKTYQAAVYAGDVSFNGGSGRLLIVTHTHAARDVFAQRTEHVKTRLEIRTIDSLITQVADAYHPQKPSVPFTRQKVLKLTAWLYCRATESTSARSRTIETCSTWP